MGRDERNRTEAIGMDARRENDPWKALRWSYKLLELRAGNIKKRSLHSRSWNIKEHRVLKIKRKQNFPDGRKNVECIFNIVARIYEINEIKNNICRKHLI